LTVKRGGGGDIVVVNGVSGGYLNNKMRTRENKTNKIGRENRIYDFVAVGGGKRI